VQSIPQPSIQRSTDTLVQHAIFTELKAFEKQFLADGRLESLFSDLVDPVLVLRHRTDPSSHEAVPNIRRHPMAHSSFPEYNDC
jgi:hypothetical protein